MPQCLNLESLQNLFSSIRIWKNHSEPFDIKRGFRQSQSLSSDFLNLILGKIICAYRTGIVFYMKNQLMAYADNIDIIGRNSMYSILKLKITGWLGNVARKKNFSSQNIRFGACCWSTKDDPNSDEKIK